MTPAARRQRGFTLIEIIAALVLMGILAATVFGFMGQAVRGFFIARDALEITQKAQIALNRMRIDFTYMDTSTATGTANSISYQTAIDGTGTPSSDAFAYAPGNTIITYRHGAGGTPVTLIDDVAPANGLVLQYRAGVAGAPKSNYVPGDIIDITLNMQDSDGATATFTTSVFPGKVTP